MSSKNNTAQQAEKFTITGGNNVNSKHVESKVLTLYEHLPAVGSPNLEAWKQRAQLYIEDLEWLTLKLPQYKFWSQMVYDPNCIKCVLSFLQNAIPVYLLSELKQYESDVQTLYCQIKTLVFSVIRKLTQCEISEDEMMSEEYMGELLYNHKILCLSTLMDICSLYSYKYPEHVSSMLNILFRIEPRYLLNLETFIDEVFENSFDFLEDVFHSKPQLVLSDSEEYPVPLSSSSQASSTISFSLITDYVLFLLDTAFTLATFVDRYPPAAQMFHRNCLEDRIARFYENTVLSMDALVKEVISRKQMPVQRQSVKNSLKLARYYLLHLYRSCISSCISNILNLDSQTSREELKSSVDGFLHTLSDSIEQDVFIADYHTLYPLHNDLDVIQQVAPHLVDHAKIDYLLEVVTMCCNSKVRKSNPPSEPGDSSEDELNQIRPVHRKHLSETELKALIGEIREMLPNLGEGFIQNCLQHYQNNVELTLNNILQDTLPTELGSIDRTLPYIPPELVEVNQSNKLPNRNNVYDDVIMDIKSVHIGKRGDNEGDLKSLLNDKSHRNEMKEFYSKIGVEEYREASEVVYDDEYDDSYDGPQDLVNVDVIPEDPALKRRDLVTPRALRPPEQRVVQSESSSDDDQYDGEGPRPLDFCQNPELMRARADQRRQTRQAQRGGGGGGPPPARDVKGAARGQGQTKEVLINRDRKHQNKAFRGNHNRRNAAGRKRAGGMIPS
uniref:Activating signal cointegrator 1 complex subunit 2 n=1 Tax=Cacopsylla melanoneura TaxID=428564 RepID=A0A8D8WN03_9HEMI